MNFLFIGTLAAVFVLFVLIVFIAGRYVRCPANRILVVQGKVGHGRNSWCINGGATFIWPLIQEAAFLDLTPMVINIPLKGALSLQNIRVNVPSTFTIAIDNGQDGMINAATRLLGLTQEEIEQKAAEIIFGQLRLTIASLTIEEINQNRDRFLEAIRNNIDSELKKFGLCLLNVNITDITDESGYIDSIGKKAASTALNQAKIDVAEQEKKGEIGKAEADKERRIQVASYNAQAVEGENSAAAKIASYNADLAEQRADADRRGQVANQVAIGKIQSERATAELKRLEAEQIVPREIDKRKIEIAAEAEAQKRRKEAAGEADAIVAVKTAEAQGILTVLNAKAQGYQGLVTSCNNNARDAATMLMVEKVQDVVKLQTEAISNLKIDKITVWDSGNSEKGSSTANFMSSMIKAVPPLQDVARMAGVELPEFLGKTSEVGESAAVKHAAAGKAGPQGAGQR